MIKVDCGRCYSCLSNKRNEWTFRMLQETKYSESSLFLTLTYDPDHIKYAWSYDTGSTAKFTLSELKSYNDPIILDYNTPTLNSKDITLFHKRLRQKIKRDTVNPDFKHPNGNPKYRHWTIGEYGSKSLRPHYHIIAWNIPDSYFRWDPLHNCYYSNKLNQLWPHGLIHIGTVTQQSIHYCSKYLQKDFNMFPENTDAERPFAFMSRKPGIGQSYINGNIKNYFNDTLNPYATTENNYKWRLPRFYKTQLWEDEARERVNEKSRLYCQEKEERQKRQAESLGVNLSTFQTDEAINGYKLMKYQNNKTISKHSRL